MPATTEDATSCTDERPTDELPLDDVYDLLRNHRRRMILRYLRSEPGASTPDELTTHIAGIESGVPEHELTDADRTRVSVALSQCHLPKLEDAGAIEFDDHGGVELTDTGVEIESRLARPVDTTAATRKELAVVLLVGSGIGAMGTIAAGRLGADPVATFALLLLVPTATAIGWPLEASD